MDELQRRLAERQAQWQAEAEADRAARQAQLAAQAEAQAQASGHYAGGEPAGPRQPDAAELVALFGGAEHASKVAQNLPAAGGIKVLPRGEDTRIREKMARFWASGGGRLPAEFQPVKPSPVAEALRPRVPPQWDDGRTWWADGTPVGG